MDADNPTAEAVSARIHRDRLLWRIWLAIVAFLIIGSFVAFGLMLLFNGHEKASRRSQTTTVDVPAQPATERRSSSHQAERPVPAASSGFVWVNTRSKIYHYPGYRWYGRTISGKYATEQDALGEGDRAALNERRPVGFGNRVPQ